MILFRHLNYLAKAEAEFKLLHFHKSTLIITWLWLKTKSVWIVSLAHGPLNNLGQYAFKHVQDLKTLYSIILLTGVETSLLLTGLIISGTMKDDYIVDEKVKIISG